MNIDWKDKKVMYGTVAIVIIILIIAVFINDPKEKTLDESSKDSSTEEVSRAVDQVSMPINKPTVNKPNVVIPVTNNSQTTVDTDEGESPIEVLVILNPFAGEMFHSGNQLNINWALVSEDLLKARIVATLLNNDRELFVLTEDGGVAAYVDNFVWDIPDLSAWGEEGFSIKIKTVGLGNELEAQSGEFKVIKSQ